MNTLLPVISIITLIVAVAAAGLSGLALQAARRAARTGEDDRLLAALSREMAALRAETAQNGAKML